MDTQLAAGGEGYSNQLVVEDVESGSGEGHGDLGQAFVRIVVRQTDTVAVEVDIPGGTVNVDLLIVHGHFDFGDDGNTKNWEWFGMTKGSY